MATWDSTFRAALASRDLGVLRVAVVFGPSYTPSTGGPGAGAEIAITNYGPPTDGFRSLGPSVKVAGASLNPVSWTVTADQMTCTIMDQAALRALLDAGVHRGTMVEVRVTLEGDNPATEYKRVWMGRLQNIVSAGNVGSMTSWTVTCYGIQAALQWRWTDLDVGNLILSAFSLAYLRNIADDDSLLAEVASAYTVGDTTLTLDSATAADFGSVIRSGGFGLAKVILTTGAVFYLRFTGTSGNTLTGVDATLTFGQTPATIGGGVGHKCKAVCMWYGHPLDVLVELLTSTGAGTNGAADVYPAQMGMNVADELVDTTDITAWKAAMASTTIYLVAEFPVANAWQWISEWTSLLGIAVVLYEGRISVRLAQDHTDITPIRAGFAFVDSAMSKVKWSMVDARNTAEGGTVLAENDLTANEDLNLRTALFSGLAGPRSMLYTLPAQPGFYVQTWGLVWDHSAATAVNDDIMDRRYHWACGIGERLDLDVPHRGPAQLCPGDLTTITTAAAFGREHAASATDTYSSSDVLVVDAAAMNWGTGQIATVGALRYRDERPPDE